MNKTTATTCENHKYCSLGSVHSRTSWFKDWRWGAVGCMGSEALACQQLHPSGR